MAKASLLRVGSSNSENFSVSDRQRANAKEWGHDSIYTPGFVRNGKAWPDYFRAELRPPPRAYDHPPLWEAIGNLALD